METAKNAPKKTTVAQRAAPPNLLEEFEKKALMVVPKRAGFRRAGYAFDGETTIPLHELTGEQYQQLTTEPMLVTFLVDLPGDSAPEASQAADNA